MLPPIQRLNPIVIQTCVACVSENATKKYKRQDPRYHDLTFVIDKYIHEKELFVYDYHLITPSDDICPVEYKICCPGGTIVRREIIKLGPNVYQLCLPPVPKPNDTWWSLFVSVRFDRRKQPRRPLESFKPSMLVCSLGRIASQLWIEPSNNKEYTITDLAYMDRTGIKGDCCMTNINRVAQGNVKWIVVLSQQPLKRLVLCLGTLGEPKCPETDMPIEYYQYLTPGVLGIRRDDYQYEGMTDWHMYVIPIEENFTVFQCALRLYTTDTGAANAVRVIGVHHITIELKSSDHTWRIRNDYWPRQTRCHAGAWLHILSA